jgi:uncharacterized protein (TIGR00369 family)
MPANAILVPGILPRGSTMSSLKRLYIPGNVRTLVGNGIVATVDRAALTQSVRKSSRIDLSPVRAEPMLGKITPQDEELCMTPLERIRSFPLPFAQLMGIRFVEADKDHVTATLEVREDLCTAGHSIHGGALMALADSVGAAATVINLPAEAKGTTTIESKTNFVSAAAAGTTITATATPVHRGRRTQVWQTRIESADKKLIALVTQTQMVL